MLSENETDRHRTERTSGVGRHARKHHDQYSHYSHEMPEDTKEATGRVIIRAVPVIYAGVIGHLTDHTVVSLILGLALSVGLDLAMGKHSIVRPMWRTCSVAGCPLIAAASRTVAKVMRMLGMHPPSSMRDMRCGVS